MIITAPVPQEVTTVHAVQATTVLITGRVAHRETSSLITAQIAPLLHHLHPEVITEEAVAAQVEAASTGRALPGVARAAAQEVVPAAGHEVVAEEINVIY